MTRHVPGDAGDTVGTQVGTRGFFLVPRGVQRPAQRELDAVQVDEPRRIRRPIFREE